MTNKEIQKRWEERDNYSGGYITGQYLYDPAIENFEILNKILKESESSLVNWNGTYYLTQKGEKEFGGMDFINNLNKEYIGDKDHAIKDCRAKFSDYRNFGEINIEYEYIFRRKMLTNELKSPN